MVNLNNEYILTFVGICYAFTIYCLPYFYFFYIILISNTECYLRIHDTCICLTV